jgi:hypothetical protein
MSAEGLRCPLSEAGVHERAADTVVRAVDAYLARPGTGPVVLYLTKTTEPGEGATTVRARVLDPPIW